MSPLTGVVAVALLIATIKTVTDFPAYVAAKQTSAILKQLIAWVAGVAGAFVLAASDLGSTIQATDTTTLASANKWTIALFGFAVASGASLTHQYFQVKDASQSAYVPPIGPAPKVMGSDVSVADAPPVAVPSPPSTSGLGLSIPIPEG